MTLEETLTRFTEALEMSRVTNWHVGDIAAEAVRQHGKQVVGKLAEVAGCSREWIVQTIRISIVFDKEKRYPDVNWSTYRAVYNAAKRTGRDGVEILEQVLDNDMSVLEIASIGTNKKAVAKLSKYCDWCGAKIYISAKGLAGTMILCPVCLAANEQSNQLGVLEDV